MPSYPPTDRPHETDRPTPKHQRYLRSLALQRGVSFSPPANKRAASQLIDEFRCRPRTPAADRRRELRAVQADMATGRGDAARVTDGEVEGYGSSATLSQWA